MKGGGHVTIHEIEADSKAIIAILAAALALRADT